MLSPSARAFAYVHRQNGDNIPDGEYDVQDREMPRRRGVEDVKWQVRWRYGWSRKSR
jgi:hypothetical protein